MVRQNETVILLSIFKIDLRFRNTQYGDVDLRTTGILLWISFLRIITISIQSAHFNLTSPVFAQDAGFIDISN